MRFRILTLLASAGLAAGYALQRLAGSQRRGEDDLKRGRFADTPLGMTWLGWKDVLARTWFAANEDRLLSVAATVAFFTVLSVAPAISVFVSLYGLFVEPAEIYRQISAVTAHLPAAARSIVEDQALRLTSKPVGTLSGALAVSLAIAAWSANAAIKGLFDGLNVIYRETEKRSFLAFNALSLLTTLGAIVLVMSALFMIAVAPRLVEQRWFALSFATTFDLVVTWLRWPAFLLVAAASIAALYAIGPSRRPARWEWIAPGAAIAAFLWMSVSAGFSWYVSTLGDYNAAYGSLATIVAFMTWLWLSATVILLGAEINAELEHQTARDTTVGDPKPMGARGAVVADNVGPATIDA